MEWLVRMDDELLEKLLEEDIEIWWVGVWCAGRLGCRIGSWRNRLRRFDRKEKLRSVEFCRILSRFGLQRFQGVVNDEFGGAQAD